MKIVNIAAAAVSACVIAGCSVIVADDLIGLSVLSTWFEKFQARPAAPLPATLVGTKDITFFAHVPIKNSEAEITTGVQYATPEDLLTGSEQKRWCYTFVPDEGVVSRRVDLGAKEGKAAPSYEALAGVTAADFAALGVTREELVRLARASCKFEGNLG